MQDIHCKDCGRWLGKALIVVGAYQLKCTNSKCKSINTKLYISQKALETLTDEQVNAIIKLESS